ncbi:SprT-like domain-containing protein [Knoellia sp. 3-2P3]|uniref:SprT-like domain-containing protein n=1 Tax=unclassified Knoellia TaxID=2618719 RepID=UPI0023D99DFB|nr:SprT-like domain-containing protein [Knoellia sp. 3-2P3]MDF2093065.1 SprT-like domain-containing protein [Knoellia sp. 3-2P3]
MQTRDALALARELVAAHGLRGWTVGLDRAKTRAGACHYGKRLITLSGPLTRLHSEADVRDTILHEIAHALVGPKHRHDEVWRATAVKIGCTGQRCVPPDAPKVAGDWLGTCPAGHEVHRHRRPQRPQSCSRCRPSFDLRHLFAWTYRGRAVAMSASYEAQLAAVRRREAEAAAARAGATDLWGAAGAALGQPRQPGPAGTKAVARLAPGTRARCLAPGKYYGVVGEVVKRGRTRYHLKVPAGILTVPFPLVEAA